MKYAKPVAFRKAVKSLVTEIGLYGISNVKEWLRAVIDKRDYYKVSPLDYKKYKNITNKLQVVGLVRHYMIVEFEKDEGRFKKELEKLVKGL